ncbi:Hypothetical predicted protein [Octopus vulgaris]|uniref:Uncharacterized protein n=1 Tax=Octopus vulgaris TaxID=6645 RepID=A0AA36BSF9_OCTVU|nr:Hypothetical predicted protein [Octopus vulgaris]
MVYLRMHLYSRNIIRMTMMMWTKMKVYNGDEERHDDDLYLEISKRKYVLDGLQKYLILNFLLGNAFSEYSHNSQATMDSNSHRIY